VHRRRKAVKGFNEEVTGGDRSRGRRREKGRKD
jgi:hypothetical protein